MTRTSDGSLTLVALLCPGDAIRDVTFDAYPDSDADTISGRKRQLWRVQFDDVTTIDAPRLAEFSIGSVPPGSTVQNPPAESPPPTGLVEATIRTANGSRISAIGATAEVTEGVILDQGGSEVTREQLQANDVAACSDE